MKDFICSCGFEADNALELCNHLDTQSLADEHIVERTNAFDECGFPSDT
jgi:hypothetical protein